MSGGHLDISGQLDISGHLILLSLIFANMHSGHLRTFLDISGYLDIWTSLDISCPDVERCQEISGNVQICPDYQRCPEMSGDVRSAWCQILNF
jgi:hypothetical protein